MAGQPWNSGNRLYLLERQPDPTGKLNHCIRRGLEQDDPFRGNSTIRVLRGALTLLKNKVIEPRPPLSGGLFFKPDSCHKGCMKE